MDRVISFFTRLPAYLLDHPALIVAGGLALGVAVVLALRTPKGQ